MSRDISKESNKQNYINRRGFLKHTGVIAVGGAIAGSLNPSRITKVKAEDQDDNSNDVKKILSVCTHCSVGCAVTAEVQNGVWIGQEPTFDSPFNLGAHCAKGASVREHAHGERRLKYPMKLVNGNWERLSWDVAINEISKKMLSIREESGADSVYWLGSAKHNNEQAYLFRKFAAFWT